MSEYNRIDSDALDRHITGNYGEDSVAPELTELWQWLEDEEESTQNWRVTLSEFYRWSLNYDSSTNPFNLFRDLIGWSEEATGSNFFDSGEGYGTVLGYLELDLLGQALQIYASAPTDVTDWMDRLSDLELKEDDA